MIPRMIRPLRALAWTAVSVPDSPVYLDHAATTPLRPQAISVAESLLRGSFGNPSGMHSEARAAKTVVEEAREVVAAELGAEPAEVVFTGGGTEADNLAVKGVPGSGGVVVSAFEHKGVLAPADRLARAGRRVARVAIDADGIVDLDALVAALDADTSLVSVMLVNNEVGTVQPLGEIAELVREHAPGALLHTDAVQAVPWLDVAHDARDAQLISISAHKFGGPKGVGALVVRDGVALDPLIEGGGQERGLRSGTTNVHGVAMMAAALRATAERRASDVARVGALRDRLSWGLLRSIPGSWINGDGVRRVAGNVHLGIPGVEAETLLVALDREGVCAAAGSSCQSGATEPSHVLAAMGVPANDALSSIRLTLGWSSTEADEVIPRIVAQLRPENASAAS